SRCNRRLVPRQWAAYICCTRRRFRISLATSSALFLPCRRALLPTFDLFTFVTCAVLASRSQDQVKTRSQKLQQLLTGAKSQLRVGINLLNPAFELTFRRPCFRS